MQTPILRSLALVTVGNAALAGRDVSAFWPGAKLLEFYKSIEFLVERDKAYGQLAADPLEWFAKLKKAGCRGLKLHSAPMHQSDPEKPKHERMMVGLVGGGPRWIIEVVHAGHTEAWEGFDRVGDQNDPQQRVWDSAYILQTESMQWDGFESDVETWIDAMRRALTDIEALARDLPGEPFADEYKTARAALDTGATTYPGFDFVKLTSLDLQARKLLAASVEGWKFGLTGSWNDVEPGMGLGLRYAQTSDNLFTTIRRALSIVANSTYPPR